MSSWKFQNGWRLSVKVGDLVNYTGDPTSVAAVVNGLVLDSRVALRGTVAQKKCLNSHQVYWATHGITNWVMERDLEAVHESR